VAETNLFLAQLVGEGDESILLIHQTLAVDLQPNRAWVHSPLRFSSQVERCIFALGPRTAS
jgi:hypothetical protein